jgi:hypothetical protein
LLPRPRESPALTVAGNGHYPLTFFFATGAANYCYRRCELSPPMSAFYAFSLATAFFSLFQTVTELVTRIALFSSYPALFASLLLLNVRVIFFLEGPYFYTKLEKKQVYVLFLIRTFCIYYLEMI